MPELFINEEAASVDHKNFSHFHGNSVFTTLRSKAGKILNLEQHCERVFAHAEYFDFFVPGFNKIEYLSKNFVKNNSRDQKIRIILSKNSWALSFEDCIVPKEIYNGVNFIFSRYEVHPQFAKFKTGNSLPYFLAHEEAKKQNAFEALLKNSDGFVVDGSRTSILKFSNDTLYLLSGGLEGIMAQEILSYANSLGVSTKREFFKSSELSGEIYLSNSSIGLIPASKNCHPIMRKIIDHFRMDRS